MSDSDEYVYDSDDDVEYDSDAAGSDVEGNDEDDELIAIENAFYEADEAREAKQPRQAFDKYKKVIELEAKYEAGGNTAPGKSFSCYKHCTIFAYELGQQDEMMAMFEKLLGFLGTVKVTANQAESAIKDVLQAVEQSSDIEFTRKVYAMTTEALQSSGNDNLLFATQLRLVKTLIDTQAFQAAHKLAEELHDTLRTASGEDDASKSTKLVEVYAAKIALATETGDTSDMETYHDKVMALQSAIPDVRTFGQIKEAFAKMHMAAGQWEKADEEFFDAMKNYTEAAERGHAVRCLQYKVLANMCAGSDMDPFSAQEAKQFESDADALAMVELRQAYAAHDVDRFHRILHDPKRNLAGDAFIAKYTAPLQRNFRAQVLVKMVKPYKVVKLAFLARRLKVPLSEVEALLVGLIHDDRLDAMVDQVQGTLAVHSASKSGDGAPEAEASASAGAGGDGGALQPSAVAGGKEAAQAAVHKWADALANLQKAMEARLA